MKRKWGRSLRGAAAACACMCLALTACGSISLPSAGGSSAVQSQGSSGSGAAAAMKLLKNRDYEDALAAYQSIVNEGGASEDVLRGMGIACMGLGDNEGAADAFEKALSMAGIVPGDKEIDINYYLGSAYYKLGRYEDAKKVYDAILTVRRNDPDALVMLGTVEMALGDESSMVKDYRKAVDEDPSDVDRIVQVFQKMQENGYAEEGRKLLKALQSGSTSYSAYDLGRLAYYSGDYETARDSLEKVRDSGGYQCAILLGQTYEALGDYNYAANVYQKYNEKDSTHAEVYNQLGLCYIKMGKYDDALKAFQKGLDIGSDEMKQSLTFNEIVATEYTGDFEKAASLMKDYIAAYPGDKSAEREYQFLQSR